MIVDLGKIESAVQPLLAQEAMDLVDLRYLRENGRWVLRFFLDKNGGMTLDDCEYISNRIGSLLDLREDLLSGAYTLEVSSPGVDRVLKRLKDFERFAGQRVKLKLKIPRAGQRHFRGFLKGVEGEEIVLEDGGAALRFGLGELDEARLDPDVKI